MAIIIARQQRGCRNAPGSVSPGRAPAGAHLTNELREGPERGVHDLELWLFIGLPQERVSRGCEVVCGMI
ncbi:hypothetical protein ACSNOI_21110 [Actinomadura kijaniata]|uniref:hypothetical protein n=1 Tax=Actinomadura kijaniata TaxID=46161 RepID=UPI003F1DE055